MPKNNNETTPAPDPKKSEEKQMKEMEELKNELQQCLTEKQEYLSGWQRAKADFINSQKEQEKKQKEFLKFSNELIITDILPILDSFDLAIKSKNLGKKSEKNDGILNGVLLIKSQFLDILKKYGVETFNSIGEKFNPESHEAIAEENGEEAGIVLEEIQKGYKLHGKINRPAKVKISK